MDRFEECSDDKREFEERFAGMVDGGGGRWLGRTRSVSHGGGFRAAISRVVDEVSFRGELMMSMISKTSGALSRVT